MLAQNLWNYRGFIISNVAREFQLKYKNSLLGALWTILNPLAMILVYTVIFTQVMQARLPGASDAATYSIYLCSGILTWNLFSEIVNRGQSVFIEKSNLIKKVSFPRLTLPLIVIINALVNFFIIFSLFLLFLIIVNKFPGFTFLGILPVLAIQIAFAIGLGISLGVLNVFFRDVGQFFGIFLQFWFWFTPIIYVIDILPEVIQPIITWNPMTPLIQAYQDIFVHHTWPDWSSLIYPALLALFFCFLGFKLFRNHSAEMVDEL